MARPEKYYARSADTRRVYPLALLPGEALKVEIDWSQILGEKATTISESRFQTDSGTVGISDALITGGVTSALVSADSVGVGMVVNVVTLAGGDQVLSRWWYVRVSDPSAGVATDYAT